MNATIEASMATGAAWATFAEQRRTVAGELAGGSEPTDVALSGRGYGETQTAETFARLLELNDEQVLKVLAVIAAEALVAGGGVAERLGELLQIDMRQCWQPDEVFLELLTDKAALAGIAAEVGAAPSAKATGKELRASIRRRLHGEGCPPVEGWLPRYFEFPTRGYTARPVTEARIAYDRLARCGDGAAHGAKDENGFEAGDETGFGIEDADETGALAE